MTTNPSGQRWATLGKVLGPGVAAWAVAKVLDLLLAAFGVVGGVLVDFLRSPNGPYCFMAAGLVGGIAWASWPAASLRLRSLSAAAKSKASDVRGEIALFELITVANHPELYSQPNPNAIQNALRFGSPFDVGLHIDNRGKPTRLRDWKFHIDTSPDGPHVTPVAEPSAWPPPGAWHKLFPDAITLTSAEAAYLKPDKVYVVYFRLRIPSPDYRSFPRPDSITVSATDNFGRVATFRARDDHAAFQNSASIPNS